MNAKEHKKIYNQEDINKFALAELKELSFNVYSNIEIAGGYILDKIPEKVFEDRDYEVCVRDMIFNYEYMLSFICALGLENAFIKHRQNVCDQINSNVVEFAQRLAYENAVHSEKI